MSFPAVAEDECLKQLNLYRTTGEWLRAQELYVVSPTDARELTHTGMDLKRISVPEKLMALFLRFVARDRFHNKPNFFCELISKVFRFFADFDLHSEQLLVEGQLLQMVSLYQTRVMCRFFPQGNHVVVVCLTRMDVQDKDGRCVYKYGIHPVWPEVYVDRAHALYIHELALAVFRRECPLPFVNGVDDYLDGNVYRAKGGLRLMGSEKMEKCAVCGRGKRGKMEDCPACAGPGDVGTGLICVGRRYVPRVAMDEAGHVSADSTQKLLASAEVAQAFCNIRCPDDTAVRSDFVFPEAAPVPPALNYTDEKLYLARAKKHKAKKSTEAALAPVAASHTSKHHMERIALFSQENKDALKKFGNKIYLERSDPVWSLLENELRRYHAKYALVELVSVFTNKSRSFFICLVDGEGAFYCMNKGENHTSSHIYFYISRRGECSQMCMSRRPVERKGEEKHCSEYAASTHPLKLHARVARALYFKPPKGAAKDHTFSKQVAKEAFLQERLAKGRQTQQHQCAQRRQFASERFQRVAAAAPHRHDVGDLRALAEIAFETRNKLIELDVVKPRATTVASAIADSVAHKQHESAGGTDNKCPLYPRREASAALVEPSNDKKHLLERGSGQALMLGKRRAKEQEGKRQAISQELKRRKQIRNGDIRDPDYNSDDDGTADQAGSTEEKTQPGDVRVVEAKYSERNGKRVCVRPRQTLVQTSSGSWCRQDEQECSMMAF